MYYYNEQVIKMRDAYLPKHEIVERVIRAKQYLDLHYAEPLHTTKLSRVAMISTYHFLRLFKRCYGRTPHQYLVEKRMEAAKRLLYARKSVAHACYDVGFTSTKSFCATFTKHTGMSPSEFKKRQSQTTVKRTFGPIFPLAMYSESQHD